MDENLETKKSSSLPKKSNDPSNRKSYKNWLSPTTSKSTSPLTSPKTSSSPVSSRKSSESPIVLLQKSSSPILSKKSPESPLSLPKKSLSPESSIKGSRKKKKSVFKRHVIPRYKYSNYSDFLLSTLAVVIGYGNIWHFPVLAVEHGGGSFLLAFCFCVGLIALPVVCIEMFIGQMSGVGVGKTLGLMSPLFQGVGWSMVCVTLVQSVEYNLLIAYCIFYLLSSFKSVLPWSECDGFFNTADCRPLQCLYSNNTDNNINCSKYLDYNVSKTISSTEEFYYNYVLYMVPTNPNKLEDYDVLSWRLVVSLFFAWLFVFGCLAFGIKISSKVSYVTVTFPYLALFFLFIAGFIMFDGAGDGLTAFFTPGEEFFALNTWVAAVLFVVYSVSIGTGTFTMMTSYNPFHNNCQRDAIIVVIMDLFTSIFAGMTAFVGLGVMANQLNTTVEEIPKGAPPRFFTLSFCLNFFAIGRNLGFILYPEGLANMPAAPFWAVLFFFMSIVIGLDTEIWLVEVVVSEIAEVFHQCREGKFRVLLVALVCFVSFVIGIVFCAKDTGVIFHTVLSTADSGWCVVLLALLEVSVVVYVYGYNRFANDISLILGQKPNCFWKITFTVSAPITLLCLLIVELSVYTPMRIRNKDLPESSYKMTWSLSLLFVSIILLFAGYRVVKCFINKQPIRSLIVPSKLWCPRKKADLEIQKKEIEAAQKGIMGEFELLADVTQESFNKS